MPVPGAKQHAVPGEKCPHKASINEAVIYKCSRTDELK